MGSGFIELETGARQSIHSGVYGEPTSWQFLVLKEVRKRHRHTQQTTMVRIGRRYVLQLDEKR